MVSCFQLVRGKGKSMDNKCYKSPTIARKEMLKTNKEFREFNNYIRKNKIDRKPIELVRVKKVNFKIKENILI